MSEAAAFDPEEIILTSAKLWMARHGELVENVAFCDGPGTVFSDRLGMSHFRAATIERLAARRCVRFEGEKPKRIASLCQ